MLLWHLLTLTVLLANITTCTVYTVTPDDHSTCHHCHSLHYYLLNSIKYFTSNTQLLFLPGLHHLHTDVIIRNVHNISLIGSTANGTTLDTVIIQCNSAVGIVMTNITDLTMKNIRISDCWTISKLELFTKFAILLKDCYNVQLNRVTIIGGLGIERFAYILLAVNTLGNSSFVDLTCNRLVLLYYKVNVNDKYHNLLIENYSILRQYHYCICDWICENPPPKQ